MGDLEGLPSHTTTPHTQKIQIPLISPRMTSCVSDVTVEKLGPLRQILQRISIKRANVSVEKRESTDFRGNASSWHCLAIQGDGASAAEFRLEDKTQVFFRFISQGKLSISLPLQKIQLLFQSSIGDKSLVAFAERMVRKGEKAELKEASDIVVKQEYLRGIKINRKPLKELSASTENRKTVSRPQKVATPLKAIEDNGAIAQLSEEQKRILDFITHQQGHLMITGAAGCGKTVLLKAIIRTLPSATTIVTASTGIAAAAIGGTTIHAFSGVARVLQQLENLDPGMPIPEEVLSQAVRGALRYDVAIHWKRCKVLIIDEISMIESTFLDLLDKVARAVRKCQQPFGGIRLVLSGDLLQLPPISRRAEVRKYCFDAFVWHELFTHPAGRIVELREVFRQRDPTFSSLLSQLRHGNCPPDLYQHLQERAVDESALLRKNEKGILPTKLVVFRSGIEEENKRMLDALSGEEVEYVCHDSGPEELLEGMGKHLSHIPAVLSLKIGAQVCLTRNLNVTAGLTNGARGVVTGFDARGLPLVRFNHHPQIQTIKPVTYTYRNLAGPDVAKRRQVPLCLAWVTSIHKSQGMTLDHVVADLRGIFEFGQAYVAVSRAKTLEGLSLLGLSPRIFRADPRICAFYNQLRRDQELLV